MYGMRIVVGHAASWSGASNGPNYALRPRADATRRDVAPPGRRRDSLPPRALARPARFERRLRAPRALSIAAVGVGAAVVGIGRARRRRPQPAPGALARRAPPLVTVVVAAGACMPYFMQRVLRQATRRSRARAGARSCRPIRLACHACRMPPPSPNAVFMARRPGCALPASARLKPRLRPCDVDISCASGPPACSS